MKPAKVADVFLRLPTVTEDVSFTNISKHETVTTNEAR